VGSGQVGLKKRQKRAKARNEPGGTPVGRGRKFKVAGENQNKIRFSKKRG